MRDDSDKETVIDAPSVPSALRHAPTNSIVPPVVFSTSKNPVQPAGHEGTLLVPGLNANSTSSKSPLAMLLGRLTVWLVPDEFVKPEFVVWTVGNVKSTLPIYSNTKSRMPQTHP